MPIYEYRCKSCGKVFEVIHSSSQRRLRTCRDCSGQLEKLVSRAAFHLKGGGWYSEGYTKGGDKKSADATTGEPTKKKSAGGKTSGGGSGSSSGGSKSKSGGDD